MKIKIILFITFLSVFILINASGNFRVISGNVADDTGKAIAGLKVRIFEKKLNSETLLGEALTGKKGEYKINYSIASGNPDIIIRVLDSNNIKIYETVIYSAQNNIVHKITVKQKSIKIKKKK